MNAQYLLDLLSPIPEENWIIGDFTDGYSKCCAIGHLRRLDSKDPSNYGTANIFRSPFDTITITNLVQRFNKQLTLSYVNDNRQKGYEYHTPKLRVIALLTDMVRAGF